VKGRGRPPDNAVFLFIDDLVQAHEEVGLKPSLRYAPRRACSCTYSLNCSSVMGTRTGPTPRLRAMAAPPADSYS
jgi:hypothetical protein